MTEISEAAKLRADQLEQFAREEQNKAEGVQFSGSFYRMALARFVQDVSDGIKGDYPLATSRQAGR